jgi:hypothetical protein
MRKARRSGPLYVSFAIPMPPETKSSVPHEGVSVGHVCHTNPMPYKDPAKQAAWLRRRKDRILARLNVERARGCSRCSEDDPRCLDFHHAKGPKLFTLAEAVSRSHSMKKVEEELAKCVVLCANCHRKEHGSMAGAGFEPATSRL